ncbi:MAG: hypothetical protein EOP84_23060 [Verrucomicrobiaceae bacterium]|nr:MAG: hypothetical protein EOP84_23060 [Verrucomicrobiaceae bacterium]
MGVLMARARPEADIEVLASEIRTLRPFGVAGVNPWLRAHLDLIDALQLNSWVPASGSASPGKWTFRDVARALERAGVTYEDKAITEAVLKARVSEIRREPGRMPGLGTTEMLRHVVQDVVHEAFRGYRLIPDPAVNKGRTAGALEEDGSYVSRSSRSEISPENPLANPTSCPALLSETERPHPVQNPLGGDTTQPGESVPALPKRAVGFGKFRSPPPPEEIDLTDPRQIAAAFAELERKKDNGKTS